MSEASATENNAAGESKFDPNNIPKPSKMVGCSRQIDIDDGSDYSAFLNAESLPTSYNRSLSYVPYFVKLTF